MPTLCTVINKLSPLRYESLPLRSREYLTATLRLRSVRPLRSHTEVYLAVILDKIRCVNRFCNGTCSLVSELHFTQIFSPALFRKNFVGCLKILAPRGRKNFVKLRRCIQFFLRLSLMIFMLIPPPPRALMTGQLFGSIQQKESRKACPLRQKLVRLPPKYRRSLPIFVFVSAMVGEYEKR